MRQIYLLRFRSPRSRECRHLHPARIPTRSRSRPCSMPLLAPPSPPPAPASPPAAVLTQPTSPAPQPAQQPSAPTSGATGDSGTSDTGSGQTSGAQNQESSSTARNSSPTTNNAAGGNASDTAIANAVAARGSKQAVAAAKAAAANANRSRHRKHDGGGQSAGRLGQQRHKFRAGNPRTERIAGGNRIGASGGCCGNSSGDSRGDRGRQCAKLRADHIRLSRSGKQEECEWLTATIRAILTLRPPAEMPRQSRLRRPPIQRRLSRPPSSRALTLPPRRLHPMDRRRPQRLAHTYRRGQAHRGRTARLPMLRSPVSRLRLPRPVSQALNRTRMPRSQA